jgi:hypothetical protein
LVRELAQVVRRPVVAVPGAWLRFQPCWAMNSAARLWRPSVICASHQVQGYRFGYKSCLPETNQGSLCDLLRGLLDHDFLNSSLS